ncbi:MULTISPECIES: UrcA family protein [unclassified Sphingomonas]|jgi:UrcA family protein|uniref:UrcA family protein n=1 Tax=unclassified Sphingomonas TaxID=196159 RepID=UPI000E10A595|nr:MULTISPECIES: UrcA family protein [unclassified Sphingomonas]AXJ96661.1 hypothetical protein DM480_15375 [Sphingomonas sp. FARSPH]
MQRFITAATAALILCAASGTAIAASDRETVSAHVSSRGLDLGTPKDRAILDARVLRAARAACALRSGDLADRADADRCIAEMRQSAVTALAARAERRPVTLASAR